MPLRHCLFIALLLAGAARAWAAAPADQDFEAGSATDGGNSSASLTVGALVFATNGGGIVETYDIAGYWGVTFTGHTGKAVIANYAGSVSAAIQTFALRSVNAADKFRLNSLVAMANEIQSGYNYAVRYKVEGYSGGPGGSVVVAVADLDLRTSGTYGSGAAAIVYTRAGSLDDGAGNGGTLSFGSGWDGIDCVVFTATDGKALQLSLDSLDFSPPAGDTTPPTIVSIVRQSPAGQTIGAGPVTFLVTYSEPVTGVTTAQFAFEKLSGDVSGSVTGVSGSDATRTVTVTLAGGAGEFRIKAVN